MANMAFNLISICEKPDEDPLKSKPTDLRTSPQMFKKKMSHL